MRPSLCVASLFMGCLFLTRGAAAQPNSPNVRWTPDMSDGAVVALNNHNRASDFDQGFDALTAGRFREAAQHLRRALKSAPSDPTTLTLYGQALEGLQDWRGAEAAFAQSLALNPNQIVARRERGVALVRLGRLDEAKSELVNLKARADACADDCVGAEDIDHALAVVQSALARSTATPAGAVLVQPSPRAAPTSG